MNRLVEKEFLKIKKNDPYYSLDKNYFTWLQNTTLLNSK